MQGMSTEPILCVWLPLLPLFSKTQMQASMPSVDGPLVNYENPGNRSNVSKFSLLGKGFGTAIGEDQKISNPKSLDP